MVSEHSPHQEEQQAAQAERAVALSELRGAIGWHATS